VARPDVTAGDTSGIQVTEYQPSNRVGVVRMPFYADGGAPSRTLIAARSRLKPWNIDPEDLDTMIDWSKV
jgi:hypothetical protein